MTNRLSTLKIPHLKDRGWYPNSNGLYLQVSKAGTKSWAFRYNRHGKQHWHGLGVLTSANSLKQARKSAEACREQLRQGIDPIDAKKDAHAQRLLEEASGKTFTECAQQYIELHRHGWKNRKHETQWINTMANYAFPVIGPLSIQAIDTCLMPKIIESFWFDKTETANRVRQRIELILDWTTARGYRQGPNSARWRGDMEKLLPKPSKVTHVKHHAALPYQQIADFYIRLRESRVSA